MGCQMWIATVDFMKAFDTIRHKSLWNALCAIQNRISLVRRLYADQQATVLTDKESDLFEIKRETKQGDPLSSLLCNTVLQATLKDDLIRWREKGMGIRLGDSQADCLSINPTVRRRRAIILNIHGKTQKHDV